MLIVGMLIATSCSDSFLDSEPITVITDVNFYKTKKDAEMAIIGCYDGLQRIYADGVAFPVASEVLSDNTFGGTGNNDALNYQVIDEFDINRSPGEVNLFNGSWVNYYRAIYRANVLLEKMDQIDWEDDEDYKKSIEAQARFIRAFCYFDMVRLWEKVPLLTEAQNGNIPQSEPDDIYEVIAEDLIFTANNGDATVQAGRVNKWVAKAYLARVFLFYTGYYNKSDLVGMYSQTDALNGLEDIISSGAGYGLVESYKNLWPASSTSINQAGDALETTYAGKDNKETLFAIKYNITSNWSGDVDGNHWLVMLGLRAQAFSPYGRGWGGGTVNPALYNAYESGDLRRDASIISINNEGLNFDNSDQREYTGFSIKKYIPLSNPDGKDVAEFNGGVSFMISQYQDYVVVRYADVLLMAAELGSANAQNYYDQVRVRAGLGTKTVSKDNILAERRFEFALEGLRYWDLLRQGVDHAASALSLQITVQNGGVDTQKTILGNNVTKTRGLQQIPQDQITRSAGLLKQNAGW
jgi:starch-binding outer membrane protein, SusD/RagB family